MRIKLSTSRRTPNYLLLLALWMSLLTPRMGVAATPQAGDPRASTGEWGALINWGIFGKHMALLPNGKVLVWPTGQDAFVWDPGTQTKVAVPATFGDLHCAAQTILADGRVLVAGGQDGAIHNGTMVTAIFDPVTNLWSQGTPMHYPRWYATTTTLPDGRVLVTSGDMPGGGRANIPEIYDPATDTWTEIVTATRDIGLYPHMYVLPNGKLYKAGTTTGTYLLDLSSGAWANGPTNAFGSPSYAESSAMYAPGKIIRSGGGDPSIANAAIVDMTSANPQWKQISSMNSPRRRHNLVILANGEVMAVGGTRAADDLGDGITTGAVYEGEIWNPATEQWTVAPRMNKDRMYHSSALLLPDGRVLAAGGENSGRLNAQIYAPPYLFKGQRPVIVSQPGVAAYGSGFSIAVNTDGSSISKVALIRPAAVTHAFDHNQRYVPLTFSQSGNMLSATAPPNANYAPPGSYMLVVTDSKGVPSVASWVRVDSAANLTPGTITGKVTDRASGDPVQGATISHSDGTTTTDANGDYTLADVLPGERLVTVSSAGYATLHRSQNVVGGETAALNLVLDPPGNIAGKVTDNDTGDPIAGATILYDGGSTTTDASGDYTITGIASGSQALIASANGYESNPDQLAVVPANGAVTADIALTPKPTYIAGEVRDSLTSQTIAGVSVSAGGVTVTTDSLGRYQIFVPPGTYSVTGSKDGYIASVHLNVIVTFGSYTAADLALTPTNPPRSFTPVADVYASSALPTTNYGTAMTLRLQTSDANSYLSYLRFDVIGLARAVESAKLRLYVTNASNTGGAVHTIANTYQGTATPWTETSLNWNNAPAIGGSPLGSVGPSPINTWVEFDVTAALSGNGTYAFGLKTAGSDTFYFSSREGSNPPQLVIQQSEHLLPAITGFSPASGVPGTEVIIIGTGFAGITSIRFNGIAASSFTIDSDKQMRVIVPAGAASGKVSLTVAGGWTASDDEFTTLAPPPPPAINSFSPAVGPAGTEVTIQGARLLGTTAVAFNGMPASSFTIDSDSRIRAIVPAGAASGAIGITTPAGNATSAQSFVVSPITPTTSLKRIYLPLMMSGGAATSKLSIFTAQSTAWPDISNALLYLCKL